MRRLAGVRLADPETAGLALRTEHLLWLGAGLGGVLAPHAARVPVWVVLCFALFAGWRLLVAVRGSPLPPRWLVALVSLATLPGVWLSYGTLLGRGAGVALLVILGGMKLLESRTLRDAHIVCLLGFFLVVTNFLYSQSIPLALYMLAVTVVLTAALAALASPGGTGAPRERLRLAATLLAQAIPLMVVLFVLFPRISGPLWGLPKDAGAARSGLSDTMSPGQISNLGLSDEVAFRVEFHGPRPPPSELYWRGPVLWSTDGVTWRMRRPGRSPRPMYAEVGGEPIDYTVTLEPHQRTWLFPLDVTTTVPRGAVMTEDFELQTFKPVRARRRDLMRSYARYRLRRLSVEQVELGLALPEGAHPLARALGQGWRTDLGEPRAVVERALAWFREQPFVYTLRPPLLERDTVDQFLFETRRGFCEFYAAAFTVLMRAAGIPARVVTGYQGGEYNPLGDYLIVRQRDAHAWVEVWLRDEGWVRVDPTAVVAPTRIEQGMDAAIPPTIGPPALALEPSEPVQRAWRWLRRGVDALDNGWNQWVLGYGASRQRHLLARLGIDADDYRQLGLALAAALGAVLVALGIALARARRERDPVVRAYRRLCAKLARAGLARRPGEGPVAYAERVGAERPGLAQALARITTLYVDLRYAARGGDPRELARAVARLRP